MGKVLDPSDLVIPTVTAGYPKGNYSIRNVVDPMIHKTKVLTLELFWLRFKPGMTRLDLVVTVLVKVKTWYDKIRSCCNCSC